MAILRTLLCLSLALCLAGCSQRSTKIDNGLIMRLKNRGPVALSSNNPFLVANLLISKEMEKSPEIAGFIDHRGAPAAIEVHKGIWGPVDLFFYYPENRESFKLEEADDIWIIRGPFTLEHEKFREVAKLTRGLGGKPKLAHSYYSPEKEFQNPGQQAALPSPDPFIEKLDAFEEPSKTTTTAFQSPSAESNRYLWEPRRTEKDSIENIIATTDSSAAEMTPKGDLVHYVTYPGETLSMIARWYTKDRANAGRLARINRLSNPNHLKIGDVIIIPSYLLRNKNLLTENAVKALTEMVQSNL